MRAPKGIIIIIIVAIIEVGIIFTTFEGAKAKYGSEGKLQLYSLPDGVAFEVMNNVTIPSNPLNRMDYDEFTRLVTRTGVVYGIARPEQTIMLYTVSNGRYYELDSRLLLLEPFSRQLEFNVENGTIYVSYTLYDTPFQSKSVNILAMSVFIIVVVGVAIYCEFDPSEPLRKFKRKIFSM